MKVRAIREHGLYESAASQLLRALRGSRSQVALARRLGYRSNPSTDWEHARRYPTAPETLRIAARLGCKLERAFETFEPAPSPRAKDGYAVAAWLECLRGSTSHVELAKRASRSRFSVGRWLSGESVPRLPDFLRLLDAINGRAAEWVAGLVPIADVPCFEPIYRRISAARRVSSDLPWSEAVLRVIETVGYEALPAHSDAYVAATLGLGVEAVKEVVALLGQAGVIERAGRRYRVAGTLVVDTKSTSQRSLDTLRRHWADVAHARIVAGEDDWFAYNVISVSRSDCARIEQLLRAAYREIRGIVRDSAPCEQAALLTLQLAQWRGP